MSTKKPELTPQEDLIAKRRKQQMQDGLLIFVAVAIRNNGDDPQVYLHKSYHDFWTIPESLYDEGESDADVAQRLENDFGVPVSNSDLVGCETRNDPNRTSVIFLVELADDPPVDDKHRWFSMKDLPTYMLKFHFDCIIPAAMAAFNSRVLK